MSAGAAALRLVEGSSMDKTKALDAALSQIERSFGKGSIMRLGKNKPVDGRGYRLHRLARPRYRARHRRAAAWRVVEIYGPEIVGQDHAGAALSGRSPEEGRHLRLHRCRACARPDLCAKARRQCRRPSDLASPTPASRRWKSPTPWCAPARSTCWSSIRSRRWCRAPSSKARWGQPARLAGPPDEPGPAQAYRSINRSNTMVISSTRSA